MRQTEPDPMDNDRDRHERVGARLCDLLTRAGPYRVAWERRVVQETSQKPCRAAVARVVADHLIDAGEIADEGVPHRRIKDRIVRALAGRGASRQTIQWLIEAFDMSEQDATELWALLDGPGETGEFLAGGWAPSSQSELAVPAWQTVSLHELHTLGVDGLPATHRTIQVVRACKQQLERYLYRFDTDTAEVTVIRGGAAGPLQDLGDGIYGVEITLTRPLSPGQTASLEYITTFAYQQPPPQEFRRAVMRRVDNLEIRIQFHLDRLPASLWWGIWDGLDGEATRLDEHSLDAEHSAHRYLQGVEKAIVGFTWRWP